ncbi:MAG: trypsin-like peptidase domain-containing protein [Coriobacteriia bacterium]|nr:trypsin-like peptidase domain-containing protein [Coriobacteriia bacterium]
MNSEYPESPTPPAPQEPVPVAAPVETVPPVAPPESTPEPQRGLSAGAVVAIALAVALFAGAIAGGFGGFAGAWLATHTRGDSTTTVKVVPPETDEPVVAAAAAALPSVVNIDVSASEVTPDESGSLPENHPGVPLRGNGSGVAFRSTDDGGTYILTNTHVVENAEEIYVTGTNRERRRGELIGADAETDIAVVKIDATLPLIELGDSDEIEVGQSATAIGSPFGLSHSVTSGVISAIGRSLPGGTGRQRNVYPLVDVIQTDAAVNPGNSGGALVDRVGRLIGVNTAIYSDTGASGGIGFAVPVNTAIRIADQLIESGSAQHPFLGIIGQDVTPEFAAAEGIGVDEGAYVVEPIEGTKAEAAGIVTGDVIVSLNDTPIRSMDDLLLQVRRHRIGERVALEIWRGDALIEVEMEVGIKPPNLDIPRSETMPEPNDLD